MLIFAKPPFTKTAWIEDLYNGNGPEKSNHDWQQALDESVYMISHLTKPGDLIVDPFLGSGTTALATIFEGRRFIGCDIDIAAVMTARQRIDVALSNRGGEPTTVGSVITREHSENTCDPK